MVTSVGRRASTAPAPEVRVEGMGAAPTAPYASFPAAAAGALALLHPLTGLDLLLVTRADPERDLQHVDAALLDGELTVLRGLSWSGSACTHMLSGSAPEVAPAIAAVPAYAAAANLRGTPLRSYVGVPLQRADAGVYGTVCGFGRSRDDGLGRTLPAFRAVARLLGTQLAAADLAEERLSEVSAQSERLLSAALRDHVTGLLGRAAVESALLREEALRERHGHAVTVVLLDVDDLKGVNDSGGHAAGDRLLRAVADALRDVARSSDIVGRVGGDEFLALLPGDGAAGSGPERLREHLVELGLPASTGAADTTEVVTIAEARELADQRLYRDKAVRRGRAG